MAFDFDTVNDRRETHSMKWDELENRFNVTDENAVAMWVADMEFLPPPAVNDALKAAADHGIHGYYGDDTSFRKALVGWMKRRHDWDVDPAWPIQTHGLVNAVSVCLQVFTQPGDGIIVFSPVYYAFMRVIEANDRRVVYSHMDERDNRFHMDLEALQASLTGTEKILILCSPHNPGGQLWSVEELRDIADFCVRNDILLISDEVHNDLVMPGYKHHVLAQVAPQANSHLITLAATTKTFNIAGCAVGSMIVADEKLRSALQHGCLAGGIMPNKFGMLMAEAAYLHGDEWLDALMEYLDGNRQVINAAIADIPGLSVMDLQATYLTWGNFSGTGMAKEDFLKRVNDAGLVPQLGEPFGPGGEDCLRFNIACSRSVLVDAMDRLAKAFSDLQ
ncbi:MAG: putative C-S lyase [Bacteroidetes bacterium]|nr:putative C-S lyase [Bacteroidota bacterium]